MNDTADNDLGMTAQRVIEYTFFSLIFVLGVIGNSLVCLVIYKTPRMHTARNALIINLAVADLTVVLLCIPFDVVLKVTGTSPWPLGAVMCKIVWPSMTLATNCSAATLTAISYDRYRAVVHPYKPKLTRMQTIVMIGVSWLVSLVLVIPYILTLQLEKGECVENWFSTSATQIYTAVLFVFQYALPVVVIGLAYTRIALKLKEQASRIHKDEKSTAPKSPKSASTDREDLALSNLPGSSSSQPEQLTLASLNRQKELRQNRNNAKIVRMLVVVFLMYAIWLLPNQIIWMRLEFGSGNIAHQDTLLTFSSLCVYISSCVNPYIYAGMNTEFRKGFMSVLKFRSGP